MMQEIPKRKSDERTGKIIKSKYLNKKIIKKERVND